MTQAATIGAELAPKVRTLVLGGTAVILHGLNRFTKDLDLWTDPNPTAEAWAAPIEAILKLHPELSALYLDDFTQQWEKVAPGQIALAAANGRIVRLIGCDRPIDLFYQPNEVERDEFNQFWNRAIPLTDGTRLLDPIDLIITKQLTDRPHDQADINFLQAKIETELCRKLPHESYPYAIAQFERFRSANTAFSATSNPDPKVRELGLSVLRNLAAEGDPFASEHLDAIRQQSV